MCSVFPHKIWVVDVGAEKAWIRDLSRDQLDRRLGEIRGLSSSIATPGAGWIAAIRSAYGMTQGDLARRMGVSQQAVSQLERRETEGSVTLAALEEAAVALNGEVVYAIVPRRPIRDTVTERARRLAGRMVGSVRQSMRLEDQDPESDVEARTNELAAELLADPSRLWSSSLDE